MLIAFFQAVAAALSWLLLKVFTRLEILGADNLREANTPLVVVANHESHLDPQLVGIALLSQPKLLPLRYMAKDNFFWIPGFNLIIWLLGAFPAHKKRGIGQALLTPVKLLEKGQSVMIFPEAHIVPARMTLGSGRRGAAILALTAHSNILPISVHTPANLTPGRFLFTRPRITIRIGVPFQLDAAKYPDLSDANVASATAEIMGKIGELYFQHTY